MTSGSGEVEPVSSELDEMEPPTQRLDEAEPVNLGVGWSCSHTLDCSDESMLITISSSSLGTLVLVPDRIPLNVCRNLKEKKN